MMGASIHIAATNNKSQWMLFLCLSATLHVVLLSVWQFPQVLQTVGGRGSQLTVTLLNPSTLVTKQAADDHAERPSPQQTEPPQEIKAAVPKQPRKVRDAPVPRPAAQEVHKAREVPSGKVSSPVPSIPPVVSTTSSEGKTDNSTELTQQLTRYVSRELARHFDYPRRAQHRGWQGTVVLGFNVETNGLITDIKVADSSGFSILDRAAKASLTSVEKIDSVLIVALQRRLSLKLPVIYRLE